MQDLVPAEVPGGFLAVKHIRHGQKVDRPGIYDMPMGWYHSDCCVGPSISSSGLRTIWQKSPLHYWHTSPLNPNRADEDDDVETEFLRIGRAAHTLLLEPGAFKSLFITRPGMYDSWRTKAAQKWRAEHQLEGFTVLDPHEMQRVHGLVSALRAHPLYQEGLLEGDIERSIIWQDAKTGVWLKARPDTIPRGSNIFADLKCVSDARAKPLARKIFDAGYDMQMALGGVGMWEVLKRSIEDFVLVAVEHTAPHGIRIAPIAHEELKRALLLLRWAINKFAACLEANSWPSFEADDTTYVGRSDFERKLIDGLIEDGTLPKEF